MNESRLATHKAGATNPSRRHGRFVIYYMTNIPSRVCLLIDDKEGRK